MLEKAEVDALMALVKKLYQYVGKEYERAEKAFREGVMNIHSAETMFAIKFDDPPTLEELRGYLE